jgi:anti-anti-sigma factor
MKITTENIDDFSVVKIDGRIDTSNYTLFEEEINKLFGRNVRNIIFNCNSLNYISSSGLRIFLVAQKKMIALKGKLYLCNLQPAIKEIFVISGFSQIFRIFDTMEEALEA